MKLVRDPTRICTILLVGFWLGFLWLGYSSDQAMDKSGQGDFAKWQTLNNAAGAMFWFAVVIWLAMLVLAVFPKFRAQRNWLISGCMWAVILAPITYLLAVFM